MISLAVIAFVLLFVHRTILGKELTLVVLSYHVVTFAAVAMAFLVLTMVPRRSAKVALASSALPVRVLERAA